jgi:hypothetical protein
MPVILRFLLSETFIVLLKFISMKKLVMLCMALFVFVAMSVYAQDAKKGTTKETAKFEAKKDSSKVKCEAKKAWADKNCAAKKDTSKKECPKKK